MRASREEQGKTWAVKMMKAVEGCRILPTHVARRIGKTSSFGSCAQKIIIMGTRGSTFQRAHRHRPIRRLEA